LKEEDFKVKVGRKKIWSFELNSCFLSRQIQYLNYCQLYAKYVQ
jgi:hypothetical protein